MNIVEIWQPKYSTKEILINPRKCIEGINYIKITKDKNYEGKLLKFNSDLLDKYSYQQNGRGIVVCIPLSQFEIILDK